MIRSNEDFEVRENETEEKVKHVTFRIKFLDESKQTDTFTHYEIHDVKVENEAIKFIYQKEGVDEIYEVNLEEFKNSLTLHDNIYEHVDTKKLVSIKIPISDYYDKVSKYL